MKLFRSILTILFFGLLLLACSKDNIDFQSYSSVKGFIKLGFNQEPIEGLTVRLIDLDAPIDTLTYQNEHLFLDSTITCARGFYKFDSLQSGKYGIMVDNKSYQYRLINESDSLIFKLEESTHLQLDLEAIPNLQSNYFIIDIDIYNISTEKVIVLDYRLGWQFFIPRWHFKKGDIHDVNNGEISIRISTIYGHTAIVYTETNNYAFKVFPDSSNTPADFSFEIHSGLSTTPSYRKYRVDYNTMVPELVESIPFQ